MLSLRIGLSLLLAGIATAQTFEVASIRLSGPRSIRGSDGGPGSKDPGRYTFNRADLETLILIAWHIQPFQLSSKLPLDRDEFDLTTKIPPGATKDDFRAMLRNLLVDRFHLQVRKEIRDFPALELVPVKAGTKLGTDAAVISSSEGMPQVPQGKSDLITRYSIVRGHQLIQMHAQQQTISRFAELLTTDRPVVDKTGLPGKYDFTLEFSRDLPGGPADAAAEPPGAPDLNTALRDQLGLRLVPKKIPFDVVVIESFDRLPTEN